MPAEMLYIRAAGSDTQAASMRPQANACGNRLADLEHARLILGFNEAAGECLRKSVCDQAIRGGEASFNEAAGECLRKCSMVSLFFSLHGKLQ